MKMLIVDDHPIVLEGLAKVFEDDGFSVAHARSCADAVMTMHDNPDTAVAVVDLYLASDECGLDVISELRKINSGLRVVVYTMYDDLWNVARILKAGVDGAVIKGEEVDRLLDAVHSVSAGEAYLSPYFAGKAEAVRNSGDILSDTDIKVLRLAGEGKGNSEIASAVFLTKKSVEYHRSNIIKKLGVKNMAEAISNAVRLGIIGCLSAVCSGAAASEPTAPETVDMGLSVYWADRNLGAPSPLEEGGYFAFGETFEKERYHWDTYTLCEDGDMFSQFYVGEESVCSTEYDAAHVVLGGDWRLPTVEEVEELIESCAFTTIEADGDRLAYVRCTAPNGASLDFPLTGYINNDKHQYVNQQSVLHSGSIYTEYGEEDGFEYCLNTPYNLAVVAGSDPLVIECSAHIGFQIRPVTTTTAGVSGLGASDSSASGVYTVDGRCLGTSLSSSSVPSGLYIVRTASGTLKKFKM